MRTALFLALLVGGAAVAAPATLGHQGRLLDSTGAALEGSHALTVSLYSEASGGTALWTETLSTELSGGYYALVLGETEVLTSDLFDADALYVGISVDGAAELPVRQRVNSAPSAFVAHSAIHVNGGVVDASEVRINGTTVLDASGLSTDVSFSDLTDVPADLADGDADLLSTLGCSDGEIAIVSGNTWTCLDPATLPVEIAQVSGVVPLDQLPMGTSENTAAYGNHSHTAEEVGALPITGGTLTGDLTVEGALVGTEATFSGVVKAQTGDFTSNVDVGGSLVVEGSLTVGDDEDDTCDNGTKGKVRYAEGLAVCDGVEWRTVRTSGVLGTTEDTPAQSCEHLALADSALPNGEYWVDPDGSESLTTAKKVYCDITGGGWTLMAVNTVDAHSSAFRQDWSTYKGGFGDFSSPFADVGWIGNDYIHALTSDGNATLKAITNNRTYTYTGWSIGDESTQYVVSVPQSSANANNALRGFRYQHGMKFSTFDRDNDEHSVNCAANEASGWWYRTCWYVQWGDQAANQTYWNEADTASDNYTSLRLWIK